MNTITATVETAINLTPHEVCRVEYAAVLLGKLALTLDAAQEVLQLAFTAAGPGWHVYRGGSHVALSRLGGTNGEDHRVLLVTEVAQTVAIVKNARTESREVRGGHAIREVQVTTWDVVRDGVLLYEASTRRDAQSWVRAKGWKVVR